MKGKRILCFYQNATQFHSQSDNVKCPARSVFLGGAGHLYGFQLRNAKLCGLISPHYLSFAVYSFYSLYDSPFLAFVLISSYLNVYIYTLCPPLCV